jgi:hypothetical protein
VSLLTLTPRDTRILRLAAYILIPSLGYVYGVKPYMASLTAMRDQMVTEQSALAREQTLLADHARNPDLQRDTDAAVLNATPLLFTGRDDIIASAELATYVTKMAEAARVNLMQAGTRPTVVSSAGVRMLRIELRGESDLEGILTFLNQLETGDKLVRFDKLDISRSAGRRADEDGFETLTMAATVSAFAIADMLPDTVKRVSTAPTALTTQGAPK